MIYYPVAGLAELVKSFRGICLCFNNSVALAIVRVATRLQHQRITHHSAKKKRVQKLG
jgi:hypothetical protein